jgi:hypothetical protein
VREKQLQRHNYWLPDMTSDLAHHLLHGAAWSTGDYTTVNLAGVRHHVEGANGENVIRASAGTAAEAWRLALEQARWPGMLREP